MKNKKLIKTIAATVVCSAMTLSAFSFTACNPDGEGGGHHHNYTWVDDEDGNCHEHCGVEGCDLPDKTPEEHTWDGDSCSKCHAPKPSESGGEEDEYDLVSTSVDFKAAAKGAPDGSDTANVTLKEDYTYGGKITFTTGNRFEPGSSCVNTQKKDITVTLDGVTNSIKIAGKFASGTAGDIVVKNSSGTEVGRAAYTGNSTAFKTIEIDNLPKGTYTIVTLTSARITELTIVEKLEKSEATGISVTPSKVDFLINEDFSASGLTVILNYANGRKDPLTASDYEVDAVTDTSVVDTNTAGKYTVTVKYKKNTAFTASYNVYVYTVDSITMHTIGYSGSEQVTLQQVALKGAASLSHDYLTVKGTGTVEGRTHTFNLPTTALNIEEVSLATFGEQTVNVSVKTDYTTGGQTLNCNYKVLVKEAVTAVNNKVEITVGETGDVKTLTQAVQLLKLSNLGEKVHKVIKLQPGTYTEKVWLDIDNVTLMGLGDNIDDTKLTYSLVEGDADPLNGSLWGLNCATLHVKGANFKAYNLAIRNDFNYLANSGNYSGTQAAQGLALCLDADGAVIYNCHLFGNQDTLYMKSGRSYYYKTQIDGNIDFIFGGASSLAYFDECKIVAINRETGTSDNPQNGYVTAPQHNADTKPNYGYVFNNCELTHEAGVNAGSMSLGRPWGAKATVAYINCSFSAAYSQKASDSKTGSTTDKIHRWNDWNADVKAENADYCEYGSTDASGAKIMETAVKGGKILSETDAAKYTAENVFGKANGKQTYTTVFKYDVQYSNLRILVGLDEGELVEDTTVNINLKDVSLASNANTPAEGLEKVNAKFGEYFTWSGQAWLEEAKPNNGVCTKTVGTKIEFKVVGEVSLVAGYELPTSDYVITYKDGKATVEFVKISGQYGDYIGGIVIDTSKTPADTQFVDVTIDYNDEGATASTPVKTVVGSTLTKPADPSRAGYTFKYWYKGDNDTVGYDFTTPVTEAFTLKAKWEAGEKEYQTITSANAATATLARKGSTADLEYSDDYYKVEGDWTNGNNHPTFREENKISFYVTAGAHIEMKAQYSNGTYTFKAVIDGKETAGVNKTTTNDMMYVDLAELLKDASGADVDVTGVERFLIEITATGTAYCHEIKVSYPA